jgi:hypothetical protein
MIYPVQWASGGALLHTKLGGCFESALAVLLSSRKRVLGYALVLGEYGSGKHVLNLRCNLKSNILSQRNVLVSCPHSP